MSGIGGIAAAGLAAPFFFYLSNLGIRQSLLGLMLVYSAIAVPFAIWTLYAATEQVPHDLEEAAALEGARPRQVFQTITLPLIAPTLAVAGFLAFLVAWSEYALAWALISAPQQITLAMALYGMRTASQVSWSLLSATALLVAIPVLVLFYGLGARAIDGLSFGVTRE
ncbi:MAG: carbohydrate ABC transporter permease [Oscillochloris sp.]|nr:carbohydrate ABC transporter permease [Oscillochloris sp.]